MLVLFCNSACASTKEIAVRPLHAADSNEEAYLSIRTSFLSTIINLIIVVGINFDKNIAQYSPPI
jgi:hypothetical protein